MDETCLILKAKDGDKKALEDLVEKYKGLIVSMSSNYYVKDHDQEDLIQMGCMWLMKSIGLYQPGKGSFKSYFANALRNNYGSLVRVKAKYNAETSLNQVIRSEENVQEEEYMSLVEDKSNFVDDIIASIDKKHLREAFKRLSVKDREILNWSYCQCKTLASFADMNGINRNSVYSVRKKALRRLREHFEKLQEDRSGDFIISEGNKNSSVQ